MIFITGGSVNTLLRQSRLSSEPLSETASASREHFLHRLAALVHEAHRAAQLGHDFLAVVDAKGVADGGVELRDLDGVVLGG